MERDIVLRGDLLDKGILSRVMTAVEEGGGRYRLLSLSVGGDRDSPSEASIRVRAEEGPNLDRLLVEIERMGGSVLPCPEAALTPVARDGVLPEGFYATTNLPTEIFLGGAWLPVAGEEMDLAIVVDPDRGAARGVPMAEVQKGELVVVGEEGVRVLHCSEAGEDPFRFMGSEISAEKPKDLLLRQVVERAREVKAGGGKILWVAGPAIVHNGGVPFLARLIEAGWVDILFAGNALAAHDIELSLYGTSLGVPLRRSGPSAAGHAHHLWAVNAVRGAGSIAAAVSAGLLRDGVMHACVRRKVPFVLAGSIRDDGPLPGVLTDAVAAQRAMRKLVPGVEMAVMVGTTLHAVATGNLLPARVFTVCVDINPAAVTKLRDRGSRQSIGIVMDASSFVEKMAQGLAGLD